MVDNLNSWTSHSTIEPVVGSSAWDAVTLQNESSWQFHLEPHHQQEILDALAYFKDKTRAQGLTAQWLHGNMVPGPDNFPLPTLGPVLLCARKDIEEKYGLYLLRGIPVSLLGLKDLHLVHAGLASYAGTVRPQTVFGEVVQDIRDVGQASLKERRGSKHNRELSFHNDPSDVVSFLCIRPSKHGGISQFCSSVSVHNAMLQTHPELVATLYEDFIHTYQEYLYVRTPWNSRLIPQDRWYTMPVFTSEDGKFACKYSRFYIDEAQQLPDVPHLTQKQKTALDIFEETLSDVKWQISLRYEPGDVMFINNFICFHARSAFEDSIDDGNLRRHLLRIWLSMPNSRELSPAWQKQIFFKKTGAGEIRGGVPFPEFPED